MRARASASARPIRQIRAGGLAARQNYGAPNAGAVPSSRRSVFGSRAYHASAGGRLAARAGGLGGDRRC